MAKAKTQTYMAKINSDGYLILSPELRKKLRVEPGDMFFVKPERKGIFRLAKAENPFEDSKKPAPKKPAKPGAKPSAKVPQVSASYQVGKKKVSGIVDRIEGNMVIVVVRDPESEDTIEVAIDRRKIKKTDLQEGDRVTVYL